MAIATNAAGEAMVLSPQGTWVPTQVATNPTTGERLALDGDKWTPIKPGADPKYDMRDLGMSAMRGVPVLGGGYEQSLSPADKARAENFDTAHPWLSTGAKVVGGGLATTAAIAALPEESLIAGVLGATRGATPLARMINSAMGGAALGGADAASRGQPIGPAAALGGGLGAAAPVVARGLEGAIGTAGNLKKVFTPIDRTQQPTMSVGNVKVGMTPSEMSGDLAGQMYNEQARKNVYGAGAKSHVDAADAARDAQLASAQQEIRQSVAGGAPVTPTNPLDAMAQTQQAVQDAAAQAKAAYKTQYGAFDTAQGSINTQPFQGISNVLQNHVSNLPQPMFAGPRAQAALDEFEQNLTARPGMSIQEVSRAMQVLKARREALSPVTDNYDRGVLGNALGAFNTHLQNTLASPHYVGDPNALGALKAGDQLFARYKQLYGTAGPGDQGGQFVQSMLKDNLSYQQMADRLYGASPKTAGELNRNIQAASRLKSILGETSPEWRTVQQGYLSNILDAVQGAQRSGPQAMTTILDNVFKGGRQFANTVLPPQALQLLDQYRAIQRQMIPLAGVVNYSNSATHLAGMAHNVFAGLAAMAGHHIAGPLGLIAGAAAHKIGPALAQGFHSRAVARNLYGSGAAPMWAPSDAATQFEKVLTRVSRSQFGR